MKINLPISLINKYLDTMELNEQVASFYNDYFNYFNDYEFNNEISLYSYIKECLEIDENDTYFKNFEKEYELNNIKELDIKKYKNDAYIKGIRLKEKIKCKGYTLDFSKYDPYYLFIYDEIKVNKNEYYRETYDVGYFKDSFTYIELNKNNITWMSTIPHEINTMKKDIDIVKNNVLVLGLGIGYFSIQKYGVMGAVYSTLTTQTVAYILSVIISNRMYPSVIRLHDLLKYGKKKI